MKPELCPTVCLGRKIANELKGYKQYIKSQSKDYLIDHAFEIDNMISIYELLMEMISSISVEEINNAFFTPDLLKTCYEKFLSMEDIITPQQNDAIKMVLCDRKGDGKIEKTGTHR